MREAQSVFLFIDPQGIGTSIKKLEEKGIYSPSLKKGGGEQTHTYHSYVRAGEQRKKNKLSFLKAPLGSNARDALCSQARHTPAKKKGMHTQKRRGV